MLLLKKVSYMPVVRWQGWKAATGKWQHRCRKDDCDTSENPNGDIKASSYAKLCLSGAKLLKHAMGIHPCRILFSFFSFLSMLSQPLWQNEGSRQTFPFKQESRKAGKQESRSRTQPYFHFTIDVDMGPKADQTLVEFAFVIAIL